MLQPGSTFRLLVTLLLAVAVPFCCCNFHSWLSECVPCEAAAHPAAVVDPVAHHHEHATAHNHESDHHVNRSAAYTEVREPILMPCGLGHDADHDCTCGKQNRLQLVVTRSFEFSTPILVTILSFPTLMDPGALSPFRTVGRDLWLAFRPPTTLLRLHCALIV